MEEVDGWAGFDEQEDLGRPLHAEEIGDGLLGAVVENMEVFTREASDELTARVGDDDADVYAVHVDMNVWGGLSCLLGKSGRDKGESESERKGRTASNGKKHGPNLHGRPGREKTEALFRRKFPESGTGLTISIALKQGKAKAWSELPLERPPE